MDKITRFINTFVPTNRCNLRCNYCYIEQNPLVHKTIEDEHLRYSIEHIAKALSPARMGGICMINLCAGGETLLYDELPELVNEFLRAGHYVSVVTNCTLTKKLHALLEAITAQRNCLFIKCSIHYLELVRLNILEQFFDNVDYIKRQGVAFTVELTANDDTIPYIPKIKDVCEKHLGTLCHIIESRNEQDTKIPRLTKLPIDKHIEAWSVFDSPLFNYQQKTFEVPVHEYCMAGDLSLLLDLRTGKLYPCNLGMPIDNLYEEITHKPNYIYVGKNCLLQNCFQRHVHSLFAGCYDDKFWVSYAEIRDRNCADGSTWLSPEICESFSHKCSEYHSAYSDDKKIFFDLLMRKYLKGADPNTSETERLSLILERNLFRKGIRRVAIYGMGNMGNWLKNLLKLTHIVVAFGIDRRVNDINCDIPVYSPNDDIPKVDTTIVSVFYDYAAIYDKLKASMIPIMSMNDIVE